MTSRNRDMVPKEKRGQCNSLTSRGTRCKLPRVKGERVCHVHKRVAQWAEKRRELLEKWGQCKSLTSRGTRCRLPRIEGERVCSVHKRFPYRRRIPPARRFWGGKRKRTNRPPSASRIRSDMERLAKKYETGQFLGGGEEDYFKKMKELSEALKEATKTERDGGI